MRSFDPLERSTRAFGFFLAGLFLFRLFFGLSTNIWFIDQHQIYLIGLKFYTTGAWPYFGPDVASHIQLPGALQGLVVGLPLYLWHQPEAPFLALAVLSFLGLGFFAWYCGRQLPQFPRWMIWGFTLTLPWVLNWSTNIDNDSYTLFGGCVFFTAFLETLPALRLRLWPAMLSFYLMGFALLWCAQFHMSYVLLIPFLGAALIFQYQEGFKNTVRACLGIGLGALTSGAFVIPTYLKYGFAAGSGGMTKAVALNHANFFDLFTVLGRFLSLASFEIPRFIGSHTSDRMAFLNQNPWLWPFAALLFLFWIFQVPAMALLAFQSRSADPRWKAVRFLTGLTVLEIYLSFLFSIKPPAAHTYYLTLPLALFYAFHAFKPWTTRRWFAPLAAALFFCNLAFHFGLALNHYPTQSLYHDRPLFTKAIQSKNYHLLGERRPQTLY